MSSAPSPLSSIFIASRTLFLPCFLDGHQSQRQLLFLISTQELQIKYIWTDWYSESRRPSEYQILCFLVWFDMYLVMALILSHCINCCWLNSTTLALGISVLEFLTLFFIHSIDGYDLAAPSQPWACELESKSAEIDPQYLMGHDLTTPLVDFQLQHWW